MNAARSVLLVDPIGRRRRAEGELFRGAGFHVLEAASAKEARARFAAGAPDLVVLERALPDGEGLSLLDLFKGNTDAFVPVLVASRLRSTSERVAGLQMGADDYLGRPCDPAEMLARACALLRVKSLQDRVQSVKKELERLALTDPLTGLYNRRYLHERLRQEFGRAQRHGQPLAVAMVDLDGFKRVNDAHGHVVGDRLLCAVGATLHRSVRDPDVVARFGGDEFAVVLPQTPWDGAVHVSERILGAVRATGVEAGGVLSVAVTASLGLAAFPAGRVATPDELVRAADDALYLAKRAGRDRLSAAAA